MKEFKKIVFFKYRNNVGAEFLGAAFWAVLFAITFFISFHLITGV